ncbi:MAG: hypothetical protein HFACDABA_01162 [Anaerolineales bacterium]|nr:hypothetical protein [Anaerolineales bacterium]
MLALDTKCPPSLIQQGPDIWAFAHCAAENIGLFPSTEKD